MKQREYAVIILLVAMIAFSGMHVVSAEKIPSWVKQAALWYGEGKTTEDDFLNAIKYLIEHEIIVIEEKKVEKAEVSEKKTKVANVIIPNGNSKMGNAGLFIPLNLEVEVGTTVVWINDDVVGHTVQSQDASGKIIGLFNSDMLNTGDRFAHKFDKEGVYNYFCTLHPWRVGIVTVR